MVLGLGWVSSQFISIVLRSLFAPVSLYLNYHSMVDGSNLSFKSKNPVDVVYKLISIN